MPSFFCPEGAYKPWPCPVGTVGVSPGLQSPQGCSPCPPGLFCNSSALTHPSGPCRPGYFCSSGATDPAPISQSFGDICPAGHFCPQHCSAPLPCPVGTFFSNRGAESRLQCSPCPPGAYCLSPGSPQPSGPCSPGYYCTGASDSPEPQASASQLLCFCHLLPPHSQSDYSICCSGHNTTYPHHTPGRGESWAPVGGGQVVLMEDAPESPLRYAEDGCANFRGATCPKGFYCPAGSSLPLPCDAGLYCSTNGLQIPSGPCEAGFYCPGGTSDPAPTPCPPGHYCPAGTSHPQPCPPGTAKGSTGGASEEDCFSCPPGYFCGSAGLAAPTGCECDLC
ncbi:uncharacterized protein LOC143131474 [Alosa pseudoharengus]|uniref:uncharacterized protein LOC143131474 n=1 Tax=Alosa pseudoharengus TaxID=34774 RepID=UPI003F898113